jgi:hypothetical protein
MAAPKLAVGMLLGGGMDMLRDRPGAVLVWTLINLAGIAGIDLMVRQMVATTGGAGASYTLIALLFLLIMAVLFTAALRAVLRPRETEFASIDFGTDELRVTGLCVLFVIFWSIAAAVVGLVTTPLRFAVAEGSGGIGSTIIMVGLTLLYMLVPSLVLATESLAFPLVLIRRRILLDEAWKLSEGHVPPLFLTYLLVFMGTTLLGLAAEAVTNWQVFAASFGGADARAAAGIARFFQVAGPVDAMTILFWILEAIRTTLLIVFMAGAMARAANILVPDEEVLTKTFS